MKPCRIATYAAFALVASLLSSCSALNGANGYASRMMETVQRTIGTR
ncbi:hypothetical protein [Haloferula sp. BvORR071]|nr:hypothetical protein [Haloferula sp. BvORR071]